MKFGKAPAFRLVHASLLALSITSTAGVHIRAPRTTRLTTSDGTTYTYDFVPAISDHPTVLLLHGFPSTRQDWRYQIKDLTAAGYGIIAPDMLGYGDSDRPIDLEAYKLKRMSGHLDELLNHENINSVVGVGHDWGTMVLSKSLYWYPERFDKVAFLSTGYTPVGTFWDVDAANVASWEHFGYSQYGYWYFFNSYNAADLMEERVCFSIFPSRYQEFD
jgi:pimeloyl-ACP methyl ester carboxylesterase